MKHPPCQVCGCQNVNVLANAIAEAVVKREILMERIESDLEIDHKRGPLHDGSHGINCLVCLPLLTIEGGKA
jgi:hypothetical protein